MDKLRIGIIGAGWPGQRHIEGYQRRDDVEIVALSDVNTGLAEEIRAQYTINGQVYGDYREMLEFAAVDAVSICTPNFLHAPMAIDALQAGKHVLLEKPLANTLEAGKRIAEQVAATDRVFMMAYNNRFRPDSIILKSYIDEGKLGEIYYAKTGWLRHAAEFSLRGWFTDKEKSGGGPLIDLGVHMLDLTLWFMGNPRPVNVTGSTYYKFTDMMSARGDHVDVEDLASAFVKLDNGATIVLDVSWVSHINEPDYVYSQLFGTAGGARIERKTGQERLDLYTTRNGATLVESPHFNAYRMQRPGYMLYESFAGEIAEFVDSIKAGRQPGATITHGLDVLRVLDAIYQSAETGVSVELHPAEEDRELAS